MNNQELIEKKRQGQLRLQEQIEELEGQIDEIKPDSSDDEALVYSRKSQAKLDKLTEEIQDLKKELQLLKPPESKPEVKPEDKPEVKPEDKPEAKPEDKPIKKRMSIKQFFTGKE